MLGPQSLPLQDQALKDEYGLACGRIQHRLQVAILQWISHVDIDKSVDIK
jgi:hypothetical protein